MPENYPTYNNSGAEQYDSSPYAGMGEEMPQQGYYGGYPQAQLPSEKADLLDKIQPTNIVSVIRHQLMGEEYMDGQWVKNPALKKRALSYLGAWDLANLMLPVSSQNVALSKISDDDIRKRTLGISKTAQKMCLQNWKVYHIRGTDQLAFVHQIIFSNTFITLKQPENAGIRDLIKGTRHESYIDSPQQKSGGFFSGLFRR